MQKCESFLSVTTSPPLLSGDVLDDGGCQAVWHWIISRKNKRQVNKSHPGFIWAAAGGAAET